VADNSLDITISDTFGIICHEVYI